MERRPLSDSESYLMKRATPGQKREMDDISRSADFPLATGEMGRQPLNEQGDHLTEVFSFAELVVGSWQEFELFRSGKRLKEAATLVERNEFIAVTLDNERRNMDVPCRIVGDEVHGILIERVVESDRFGIAQDVRNGVGCFPSMHSLVTEFQPQFLAEIHHRTFQCQT